MRIPLILVLMFLAGCVDPIEVDPNPPAQRPEPTPPPRAPSREEPSDPPPPRAPKEKPPAPQPPPPPPPQESAPPPPKSEEKGVNLPVEAVDLGDPDRKTHSVIVFAAERDAARHALDTHRSHKEAEIEKLPTPRGGSAAALYLVWGYYPPPAPHERSVKAVLDGTTNRIRVTVPPLATGKPGDGIGMDWGIDKKRTFVFVGFRALLSALKAGDYTYEVVEEVPGKKAPRTLAEGTFTLTK
jgi:hypothetical protein